MTMIEQPPTTTSQADIVFSVPDSSQSFELPIGPGMYIAKLNKIVAAPAGDFGPNIDWYWEIYNTYADANDVKPASHNADGSVWCFRERTSVKFGANPKSGVKAKARERAEALLKREFQDGEQMRGSDLIGKPAILHLIWRTGSDGQRQYLSVAHIEPYRKGMLAPLQPSSDADLDGDGAPF